MRPNLVSASEAQFSESTEIIVTREQKGSVLVQTVLSMACMTFTNYCAQAVKPDLRAYRPPKAYNGFAFSQKTMDNTWGDKSEAFSQIQSSSVSPLGLTTTSTSLKFYTTTSKLKISSCILFQLYQLSSNS